MTSIKTYRFKLSEEISSILNEFSKLYMHEDRDDYNLHWELLL